MERKIYEDKVRGCWFGKCLAGAIGMPFEGVPFSFDYTEDQIHLQDVPNDDLELQLVWLDAMKHFGMKLGYAELADIWKNRICHGCDEYSIAIHNIRHGVLPPASGWKNNFFVDGMGATIRSEIWALLFPDRPDVAAHFAQQDAEVDHWGDGVWGEVFMAIAEAHVFMHSDIEAALRTALEAVDHSSRLYQSVSKVFELYDRGAGDEESRDYLLLHEQRRSNFTDCVMNICFDVHALLRCGGDFLKTILTVTSFGRDTDCTAATCGAFLGAARGMEVFPVKWINAVKNELCLSPFVAEIPEVPLTLDELVRQTVEMHDRLADLIPAEKMPAYVPYVPQDNLPKYDCSSWLILRGDGPEVLELEAELKATGTCPERFRKYLVNFESLFLDLSEYGKNYDTLHLFSFLNVTNQDTPSDEMVLSATADVGQTLWIDGRRVMNHHSRQLMMPSFHRAEGGAAFLYPMAAGERHFIHWQFYYTHAPLRACIMVGNTRNDHLDGFEFKI